MNKQETDVVSRGEQLRTIGERYFDALRRKDFSAIPYSNNAMLRAPLAPGGVNKPLVGKEALLTHWWQPLEPALEGVQITVLDYYINEPMTAFVVEAEIQINAMNPPVTLRVADRFAVSDAGEIIEQENHFDPRDVTNPGWQNG